MFITVNGKRHPVAVGGVVYNVKLAIGKYRPFRMREGESLEHFETYVQRKATSVPSEV